MGMERASAVNAESCCGFKFFLESMMRYCLPASYQLLIEFQLILTFYSFEGTGRLVYNSNL